jgi:cytochrome c oxidase subunit 3
MKKAFAINQFQFFPFHLVTPSPWPILISFSLLTMTTGAVLFMHGYYLGGYILTLGFIITTFGMALWLRDIITEATLPTNFNNILFKNRTKEQNYIIN